VKIGYDNNADADILDAGDDLQASDDFGSNAMSLSYDNNGNLTDDGVMHFVYDAWNRLRKAQRVAAGDTTTFGTYSYYADTRRAGKVVEHCGPEAVANDGGDQTVTFYYGGVPSGAGVSAGLNGVTRWNIFETRNGSQQATRQWVWGTRYVDEVLFMDVNGDPGTNNLCDPDDPNAPEGTKRYHYHQDRNWNVIALTEGAGGVDGRIAERYSYTPYGEFVVLRGDSGNGTLGRALHVSAVGNTVAHQGLPFDPEKTSYQNRWREYVKTVQQFAGRDPTGLADDSDPRQQYREGSNLHLYMRNAPLLLTDSSGLCYGISSCLQSDLSGMCYSSTSCVNSWTGDFCYQRAWGRNYSYSGTCQPAKYCWDCWITDRCCLQCVYRPTPIWLPPIAPPRGA